MEYVIRLDGTTADLAVIERHLVDLDPAAVVDRDAASGHLRCSTSVPTADLMLALADAGHPVAPDAIRCLPSVCCGGCSG